MHLKNSPKNMYVMQGSLKTQEEKEKKKLPCTQIMAH